MECQQKASAVRDSHPEMPPLKTESQDLDLDPVARLLRLWQAEQYPDLDRFLADAAPLSPAEFAAVLRVDQRYGGSWESALRPSTI
jgi:hypothetical protein